MATWIYLTVKRHARQMKPNGMGFNMKQKSQPRHRQFISFYADNSPLMFLKKNVTISISATCDVTLIFIKINIHDIWSWWMRRITVIRDDFLLVFRRDRQCNMFAPIDVMKLTTYSSALLRTTNGMTFKLFYAFLVCSTNPIDVCGSRSTTVNIGSTIGGRNHFLLRTVRLAVLTLAHQKFNSVEFRFICSLIAALLIQLISLSLSAVRISAPMLKYLR